ncbi:sugar MFS transporter [uncultured Microbulbifer sp.]|uniref:sugar MFS transporter n=1 Tax=uncultured Microbulbifer sp. TaxID=348147 RepID=UPI00260FB550|nr:sugar MFS transporter [uncultured Microbulbifer sp.]
MLINTRSSSLLPMLIIGILFFTFGFVTWLNGSLIPFLQIACELSHTEAYLVTMAFYIAYTIMALPMSMVLRRTGYKNGMVLGLLVMMVGSLIFIPAALSRTYGVFLMGLMVLGTGLTILQTAANPYIVVIGPRETAAVRISMMGVLNKLAGVVAPLVFTAWVLSDISQFSEGALTAMSVSDKTEALVDLSSRLMTPYAIMAMLLLLLAAFVKFSPLPEPDLGEESTESGISRSILSHPQLMLGVAALFCYVGAEVIAGDTIGLFGKGLGVNNFGQLTSYTMGFMVVGYLIGMLLIPRWISQSKALMVSAALGIVLSVLIYTASPDSYGVWSSLLLWTGVQGIPNVVLYVALFGLANALVWPAIWPMALEGLDAKETSTGSALLIMAIAGGALLPMLYGLVADILQDSQTSYLLMIPCYLFILFYAFKGHKLRQW